MGIMKTSRGNGFTIVELLIVIVVIAILAAITVVAYNGIADRSRQSKIKQDMASLQKAIMVARTAKNDASLTVVTGSNATGGGCWNQATGTNLATLSVSDACWTRYNATLAAISTASGINVNGLIDPWGRPYYMDENEGENGTCNTRDAIGYYAQPFTTGQTMVKVVLIPYGTPGCA